MKFYIRDLFLVTVIVAMAAGWWVDRRSEIAWRKEAEKSIEKMAIELLRSGYTIGVGKRGIPAVADMSRPTSIAPVSTPASR